MHQHFRAGHCSHLLLLLLLTPETLKSSAGECQHDGEEPRYMIPLRPPHNRMMSDKSGRRQPQTLVGRLDLVAALLEGRSWRLKSCGCAQRSSRTPLCWTKLIIKVQKKGAAKHDGFLALAQTRWSDSCCRLYVCLLLTFHTCYLVKKGPRTAVDAVYNYGDPSNQTLQCHATCIAVD